MGNSRHRRVESETELGDAVAVELVGEVEDGAVVGDGVAVGDGEAENIETGEDEEGEDVAGMVEEIEE